MEELKETIETKVEEKKKNKKTNQPKTKECRVLHYNKRTKIAIIDFDGCGFDVQLTEQPGEKIEIKYYGNLHSVNFRIEA